MRAFLLRFFSGAMFVPCAYAYSEHWPIYAAVPLLVAFGFLNFADGFERSKKVP